MHAVLASSGGLLDTATAWATVGGTIAAVVGAFSAVLAVRQAIRRTKADAAAAVSQETLEHRLEELAASTRTSARLVEQVSAELDARAATAKRLEQEADATDSPAKLRAEHADTMRRMLDAELAGAARGIRRDSIAIAITSFVAGGGVALVVTLLVHPFH